jgi:hypothetical protein
MGYKLLPTMRVLSRRVWHQSGRVGVTALPVFVALVLLAQTSMPAHVHGDGEPGLYSAQCPLAALATTQRDGPVSAMPVAGWAAVVTLFLIFIPTVGTSDSPFDLAASRAPPLA